MKKKLIFYSIIPSHLDRSGKERSFSQSYSNLLLQLSSRLKEQKIFSLNRLEIMTTYERTRTLDVFHDIKRCVNPCFLFSHAQPLLPRGGEGEIVRENRSTSTSTSPSTFQLRAACLLAGVGRMVNRVIRFFFNVAYLAAIPPFSPLSSLISSLIK